MMAATNPIHRPETNREVPHFTIDFATKDFSTN